MSMRIFDNIKHTLRVAESVAEVLLITALYYLVWLRAYSPEMTLSNFGSGNYALVGIYFGLCLILFYYSDGLKFGHLKLTNVVVSQWIDLLIVNFITYFQLCMMAERMLRVVPLLILIVAESGLALACSYGFTALYHRFYTPRRMLMVYRDGSSLALKYKMDTRSDKYQIKALISEEKGYEFIAGEIPKYDAVVLSDISSKLRNDLVKFCYQHDKRTYAIPKISDVIIRGADEINLFDTPLMLIHAGGLTFAQRFFKRGMDIVLSLIALAVFWPVMLIIAAAIKLEDHGPVFYKQRRCTRNCEEFDILKFRSMIVNAEKEGRSIPATNHDPRITRVGRVIRALRVDELPQIFNILSGKMSVVGPRPERIEHVRKYTAEIPEFAFRSKVKGGLTGYAQVYGKYNTTPHDKLKLDLTYIENYSFLLDCKLILMTVATMFKKESTEGFDKQVKASADACSCECEQEKEEEYTAVH